MKKILKKTKEERIKETLVLPIKVEDTRNFFWACEKCLTAFFAGDTVLRSANGEFYCKNSIKTFFGERTCKGRIYGGDEKCFNEYYKIVDPLPPTK